MAFDVTLHKRTTKRWILTIKSGFFLWIHKTVLLTLCLFTSVFHFRCVPIGNGEIRNCQSKTPIKTNQIFVNFLIFNNPVLIQDLSLNRPPFSSMPAQASLCLLRIEIIDSDNSLVDEGNFHFHFLCLAMSTQF